ncbi:hypothetical protein AB4331_02370 [Vibrio breoganii]
MTSNLAWQLSNEELTTLTVDSDSEELFEFRDYEREVEDKYSYGGHCDLLEIAYRGDIKTFERVLRDYRAILRKSVSAQKAESRKR